MANEEFEERKLNILITKIKNVFVNFNPIKPNINEIQDSEHILYKKFEQDYIKDFNSIIIKHLSRIGNDLIDTSEDAYIKENSTMFKNKLVEYIENRVINGID